MKANPKVQIDLDDIMLNKLRHSMKKKNNKPCQFPPIQDCYKYQVEDTIHKATCWEAEERRYMEVEEGAHS